MMTLADKGADIAADIVYKQPLMGMFYLLTLSFHRKGVLLTG